MKKNSIIIEPQRLSGTVNVPPSKSLSHRGIMCAGLSEDISVVENLIYSDDIFTTIEAMKQFGMQVLSEEKVGERYRLTLQNKSISKLKDQNYKIISEPTTIHCSESGTTIRFLMPFFTLSSAPMTFTGKGRLGERPYETFYKILRNQNIPYETTEGLLPVTITGTLKPDNFQMAGNVSSQFISGLMLILPLLGETSKIELTTPLESKGYVDLTIDTSRQFGVSVDMPDAQTFVINGNQHYKGTTYAVEGDYSQAAFWLVAGSLGNDVVLEGMQKTSLQGDHAILEIVERLGGKITWQSEGVKSTESALKTAVVDASQCPDLVPVLTVLLSMGNGTSEIINAGRLRIKESDRLKAICTELNKMGGQVEELDEGLKIKGVQGFKGAVVDSWNDHRIAMALAIAATRADGPVEITGFEAVKKSYPMFWVDYEKLGGVIHGESDWRNL